MAEDWRVKVTFEEEHHGHRLSGWLSGHQLEEDLAERLRGRVVVSQDGPTLFLYADNSEQADAVVQVVRRFLTEYEAAGDIEVRRWHELEERWEDPSVPLPDTEAEREDERERLTEEEREESREDGLDEWEVQVTLPDHHSTRELGERLEREGLDVHRRWRYLVIPVASEEDGQALAERIRSEAPSGAEVNVEGSYGAVVARAPGFSAFSLFGGLGA
jgi:hypothetical protein